MHSKYQVTAFLIVSILLGSTYYWLNVSQQSKSFDTSNNIKVENNTDDIVIHSPAISKTDILLETKDTLRSRETDSFNIDIGGESITIQLQNHQSYRLDYDLPTTAIQMYDDLSKRSQNGDVAASRALGINLGICNEAEKTQASLDSRTDLINKALAYEGPKEHHGTYGTYKEGQMFIDQLKSDYAFCGSISQDKIDERLQFLDLAAEGGDYVAARFIQSEHYKAKDLENGFLASWRLWDDFGSMHSLLAMSDAVAEGQVPSTFDLVSNFNTNFDNKVLSHSLLILGMEAKAITYQKFPLQVITEILVEDDYALAEAAAKLTPLDVVNAETLARQLLRNNKKCCAVDY